MVAITSETELEGVFRDLISGYTVKRAEEIDIDVTGAEVFVMMINVAELQGKTFKYGNKGAVPHTLLIYCCPSVTPPGDTTDWDVSEISSGGIVVPATSMSGSLTFNNEYNWLIVTVTGGGVVADVGNLFFQGDR